MAYNPPTGSTVAFQSDPTKLVGTVSVASIPNSSVQVVGVQPAHSVATLQGTNPWIVQLTSGSIATTVSTGNSSVMLTPGTNTIGSVATLQGTNPWVVQLTSGSVATTVGNSSVQVLNFPLTQNISGSVAATGSITALQGTNPWVIGNTSVSGSGVFNTNHVGNGSIMAVGNAASGAADSGNPVKVGGIYNLTAPTFIDGQRGDLQLSSRGALKATLFLNDSTTKVSALPDNADATAVSATADKFGVVSRGTVFNGTSWDRMPGDTTGVTVKAIGSIITVSKDSSVLAGLTSTNASLIGVNKVTRNDAVASFVGVDLTTRFQASDSAGRILTKPFSPEESRVEGYNSIVSTSVTTLVAAAGAGIRNYVTDAWFVNTGSVATLITIKDGAGSILGYTITPAGGGSNIIGLATPIRTGANATLDFQAATAVSVLYGTVKGFKAP